MYNSGLQVLKGRESQELLFNGFEVLFLDDINVLEIDGDDGCTTM